MDKTTRNLLLFLVITFVWTWAFYAPIVISGSSPYSLPWSILLILGGAGPSVIGVTMVLLTKDKEQRRDYWRRCFACKRIHLRWWAVIFLIFPLIFGASIALDAALGGSLPGMTQLKSLMANPILWPLAALISFMSGPWSEEFGWRGYALDPFLKRMGTIPGSAALGVVWGIWHLPLYFMADTWHAEMGFKLAGFWTFIGLNIGLSLIMTWVYMSTNRSILAGMLLHFTSNFTAQLFAPTSDRVEITRVVMTLVIGLTACALLEHRSRVQERNMAEAVRPA